VGCNIVLSFGVAVNTSSPCIRELLHVLHPLETTSDGCIAMDFLTVSGQECVGDEVAVYGEEERYFIWCVQFFFSILKRAHLKADVGLIDSRDGLRSMGPILRLGCMSFPAFG
jgi:hypothetical protein